MNKVILTEVRLTKDPELRYLPGTGTPKLTFTVACGRGYKKDDKEVTDFLLVELMSKSADKLVNHLYKGQRVNVFGSYHRDSWKDENGNWREKNYISADIYKGIEIVDWKKDGEASNFEPTGMTPEGFAALDDDSIPF